MAVLTARQRHGLRSSVFGLPKSRRFPMPDADHAKIAKSFASRMYHRGQLSASQRAAIFAKANRVLGHSGRGLRRAA